MREKTTVGFLGAIFYQVTFQSRNVFPVIFIVLKSYAACMVALPVNALRKEIRVFNVQQTIIGCMVLQSIAIKSRRLSFFFHLGVKISKSDTNYSVREGAHGFFKEGRR